MIYKDHHCAIVYVFLLIIPSYTKLFPSEFLSVLSLYGERRNYTDTKREVNVTTISFDPASVCVYVLLLQINLI